MTDLQHLEDALKGNLRESYVTSGDSRSLALRLQQAEFLMLVSTPRGPKERQHLDDAVAAVVGGVLKPALRRGSAVFRSRSEDAYSGDVGYSAAMAALNGLTALGYLRHHPGLRYEHDNGFSENPGWTGLASRYEATEALVVL